jgi:hypothetical protein
VLGWNVAVTVFAAVTVTVHVAPLTVVQPVQLFRIELASGVAVSVTVPPFATGAVQPSVEPAMQAMPGPVTVPLPPCATAFTVNGYVLGWNVAVTVFADVTVTVHVAPLTLVQPVQLFRIEVASGVAVSVTVPPFATLVVHPTVEPAVQAMPGPVTVPTPPCVAAVTVSWYVLGWNVAVTDFAAVIVTVQVAPFVVVHPLQLLKIDVASGTAVSVIVVPFGSA